MTEEMTRLVAEHGVQCIDGQKKAVERGVGEMGGWELKSFAILHSCYREVIYLDADNFPLVDPTYLFEALPYREHGAVFWPDYGRIKSVDRIWNLTGVSYRDEPAFESGQILIDKSRCWEPLNLTLWLNQNSDFWYRYLFGDKDTFHLAWRKLKREYAMPERKIAHLQYGMGQHDFSGRRIFQHRNRAKWVLSGWNPKTDDFEQEDRGFALLDELRQRWHPKLIKYDLSATERLQTRGNSTRPVPQIPRVIPDFFRLLLTTWSHGI